MAKRTPVLRLARVSLLASAVGLVIVDSSPGVRAQEGPVPVAQAGIDAAEADGVTPPPGYVIGAGDRLRVVFWREESMSAEVEVRPDGMISLPLLNDVAAAGLTPEELRQRRPECLSESSFVTLLPSSISTKFRISSFSQTCMGSSPFLRLSKVS